MAKEDLQQTHTIHTSHYDEKMRTFFNQRGQAHQKSEEAIEMEKSLHERFQTAFELLTKAEKDRPLPIDNKFSSRQIGLDQGDRAK